MVGSIWFDIWPSGIGRRVEELALLSINPSPWPAPLDDVCLKTG